MTPKRGPIAFAGWQSVKADDGVTLHVVPVNDTVTHERTGDCGCRPTKNDGLKLWVHHAADCREHYEDLPVM